MSELPLKGYDSLCKKDAETIVSKDKKNSQCHIAHNPKKSYVTHYKIDGVVLLSGNKCDYLVMNETEKRAFLIELKGSDLCYAAKQLENTAKSLEKSLATYALHFRIIANKCKTQEIESSEFKKSRMRWGKKLIYRSAKYEEDI